VAGLTGPPGSRSTADWAEGHRADLGVSAFVEIGAKGRVHPIDQRRES
jgi:hypothetical protein